MKVALWGPLRPGSTAWRVEGLQLGRRRCLCGRSLGLVLTPRFVDILFLQHRWRGVPACFTLLSSLVQKFAWGSGVSRNLGLIHCSLSKPDLGEVSWLYITPTLVGFRAPRPIWFLLVSSQESYSVVGTAGGGGRALGFITCSTQAVVILALFKVLGRALSTL